MSWIEANVNWILIVTGIMTASMIVYTFAPRFMVQYYFRETLDGTGPTMLARSWGLLIFGIGLLLIYASGNEAVRLPVLIFATLSKLAFAGMILGQGARMRKLPAGHTAIGDLIMAALFLWYLAATEL